MSSFSATRRLPNSIKIRICLAMAWLGIYTPFRDLGYEGTWWFLLPVVGVVASLCPVRFFPKRLVVELAVLGTIALLLSEVFFAVSIYVFALFGVHLAYEFVLYRQERRAD